MARHAQVHAALNDWETYISGAGAGIQDLRTGKAWRPRSIVLEVDPPLHDVTRAVLSRVLSPAAIRKLRADFETEAARLTDLLVARGSFDAVTDLAVPFPLKVMGDAVGVPAGRRECLLPFSNMLFNSFGPENEIFRQSVTESEHVLKELFAQCERSSLSPDGFGAQIYQAADEGRITQEQAPTLVRSILSAGFDTTVAGLGNAIYAFAANPEQWTLLRATLPCNVRPSMRSSAGNRRCRRSSGRRRARSRSTTRGSRQTGKSCCCSRLPIAIRASGPIRTGWS